MDKPASQILTYANWNIFDAIRAEIAEGKLDWQKCQFFAVEDGVITEFHVNKFGSIDNWPKSQDENIRYVERILTASIKTYQKEEAEKEQAHG